MEIADKSILIIGGAGFVGSGLVRKLLTRSPKRVHCIDNLLSSEPENLPSDSRVTLQVASCSKQEVVDAIPDEFDIIFHLATFHGNESSIIDPMADHENNLVPTLLLYERFKNFKNLKRLVYVSTGCSLAHKGISTEPVVESDNATLDLDSPYQISKIVGEMYSLYYKRLYNLPVVRARFQNVYGPGEVLGAGKWRGSAATIWRNVVPAFIFRALNKQPLLIHGDGSAARDFIYVDDIAEGLIRCGTVQGIDGDVFNLAFGTCTPIKELAEEINRLTENPAGIEMIPQRNWDRSIARFGSTEKSEKILNFRAKTDISGGLKETVKWSKENLAFIKKTIQKHSQHHSVT